MLASLDVDLLAIARTDAEAAALIASAIDPRGHAFILGSTNPALPPLYELMAEAERAGKTGERATRSGDAEALERRYRAAV